MSIAWRVAAGVVTVGGVAIFGGTLATDDDTERDEVGNITRGGGLGAFVVRVGDCMNLPNGELVASVEGVPCDTAHDGEAYAKYALAGISPFDQDEALAQGTQGCVDRWTTEIGTIYADDPELDLYVLVPTAMSWKGGDREVTCILTAIEGSPLTGSRRLQ